MHKLVYINCTLYTNYYIFVIMKKIIFLLFASLQLSAQINATFEVDLTQYSGNYTTVEFLEEVKLTQ